LYKSGEEVTFKKNNREFKTIIKGVNKNGELLIGSGEPSTLAYGSVDWVTR
jgi:biotin-(acetyl-CoA carboxylase) ligase